MSYNVIRIEFTKSTKKFAPIAWLIQKVQGTEYNHVQFRWHNSTGTNVIYHASGSQIHFLGEMAQEEMKSEVVKAYEFTVTKEQYRKLVKRCMEYAGVKYSFCQVLQIGVSQLFGIRPWKSNQEYAQVCSEVVARVLEHVLQIDLNLDPDMAGPREIDIALENESVMRKIV